MWRSRSNWFDASELAVIAFLERVIQVRSGVLFTVVLNLVAALGFHHGAVIQLEAIGGVGQVLFLHQHPLEGLGVEAEGGALLEPLVIGVQVDILEILVGIISGYVGRLGDRRVDPFLRGRLHIHVLGRGHLVGGDEVVRQVAALALGLRQRVRIDELAVGQQLVAEYVDLFLGLLALTYDVAGVVVGKARFDTIGGVVGQRQGNGAGRGDRAVVGKARGLLGQR